jgi:hypothetical protein
MKPLLDAHIQKRSFIVTSNNAEPAPILPAFMPSPQLFHWDPGYADLSKVTVNIDPKMDFPVEKDGYDLLMQPDGCTITAGSETSARWGRDTVAHLVTQTSDGGAMPAGRIRDWPELEMRAVHVDMKYFTPQFDWLIKWLEQLSAWKINTVIMEYEDKFPFRKAQDVAHRTAWTPDQVKQFIARAGELGIEVIPLIQTLGHLEYVLVHERYAHLRELPGIYSQACPANGGTLELITTMLSEVIELHPDLKYLHIGADETAFLGKCDACSKVGDALAVYIGYISKVCQWVQDRGIRPILWDDIVRKDPRRVTDLPKSAVLMYWDYGVSRSVVHKKKQSLNSSYEMHISDFDPNENHPTPHIAYRELGYDVITAPCFTSGGLVPGTGANRYMAEEAALHDCLGVASTSWVCLMTPLSFAYCSLAATADNAWNPLVGAREKSTNRSAGVEVDFARRFCRGSLGLPDDTFITAMRLMGSGFRYIPGNEVYPTSLTQPSFVDPSLIMSRDEYGALGATLFHPDWPTASKVPSWAEMGAAKTKLLCESYSPSYIQAVVTENLARVRSGLETLTSLAGDVTRNQSYAEDVLAGANARLWRLEHLLCELQGKAVPDARPEVRGKLIESYEKILTKEDAKLLSDFLLVGMP